MLHTLSSAIFAPLYDDVVRTYGIFLLNLIHRRLLLAGVPAKDLEKNIYDIRSEATLSQSI